MKTILFICPYFGKLPIAHMKLWLLSCEKNPTINWLILTDDYTEELKCEGGLYNLGSYKATGAKDV